MSQRFSKRSGSWGKPRGRVRMDLIDAFYRNQEKSMIDPTTTELEAMHSCLKPFGEVSREIGYNKPLR
ncbi:hypothetical protein CCP4SC76_7990003 [Gammaproteobacteria bacterium]